MRVLIVGEGPDEEAALPAVVRRLNGNVRDVVFDRFKNAPRRLHGRGQRLYKRAVDWIMEASHRGFDAVVLLIDEDGDADRRLAINTAQEHASTSFPRACGVAIRTFDAWFLADERALSSTLDREIQRQPDPESQRHPKAECEALIAQSGIVSRSDLYRRLVDCMSLETVRERCPAGFRPFAERVEVLGAAAQSN